VSALLVALSVAVSAVVALCAGALDHLDGATVAHAVLAGGSAFGGTLALALLLLSALGLLQ
jgi:hypothetical protein